MPHFIAFIQTNFHLANFSVIPRVWPKRGQRRCVALQCPDERRERWLRRWRSSGSDTHSCIRVFVYKFKGTDTHMHAYLYPYVVFLCIYQCVYVYSICMCVYMYLRVYISMHTSMYVHGRCAINNITQTYTQTHTPKQHHTSAHKFTRSHVTKPTASARGRPSPRVRRLQRATDSDPSAPDRKWRGWWRLICLCGGRSLLPVSPCVYFFKCFNALFLFYFLTP